jgi:hypothetical protein
MAAPMPLLPPVTRILLGAGVAMAVEILTMIAKKRIRATVAMITDCNIMVSGEW